MNATWIESEKAWQTGEALRLKVSMNPEEAPYLLMPGAELQLFVDEKRMSFSPGAENPFETTIDHAELPAGEHLVTANWVSGHGPVGVGSIKILVRGKQSGGNQ